MFELLQYSGLMARNSPVKITDPESKEAVGYRLKCYRKGLGAGNITQAYLSEKLEGTPGGQLWGNYEAGTRKPRADMAKKIEANFGLPRAWVLYARDDVLPPHIRDIIKVGAARIEDEERKKRQS